MTDLLVHQFPCRQDNYGVLVRDPTAGVTAAIDAPETEAVRQALSETGWPLTHIFVTHHHGDHTAGIADLKRETGATVIGPRAEAHKIEGLDVTVGEPETFRFGEVDVSVLDTPGHTAGHVSYWIPSSRLAFVGDTLFAMGCGRVFEGTHEMMWQSLSKIASLPPDTVVYCGHEYTLANAEFCLGIEPGNSALQARLDEVRSLRGNGNPTLPTTIAVELQTNAFLRVRETAIREHLGLQNAEDWQVFAEIRERKNRG